MDAERSPVHLVVMGTAGTGKSTVARLIAESTGRPLAEADDFHPEANIAKMSAGIPLDDEDREPWLQALAAWASEQARSGHGAVVTCSALKRAYRDTLRTAQGRVVFAHLTGDPELIRQRLAARPGHFMPPSLLPSQLEALEPLADDEAGAEFDIADSPEELADAILSTLASDALTTEEQP